MSKIKGNKTERELIHMLHDAEWGIIRSAGSGSTPLPSTDVVAGDGKRVLAIECKSLKYTTKYFYPSEINQLLEFSKRFGAEPWIGLRFDREAWYFIQPKDLGVTKNGNFNMSLAQAKMKARTFDQLIKKRGVKLR